jgi:hypothetical protein
VRAKNLEVLAEFRGEEGGVVGGGFGLFEYQLFAEPHVQINYFYIRPSSQQRFLKSSLYIKWSSNDFKIKMKINNKK